MSDEISTELLADWLEGRLSPQASAELEATLANASAETTERVKWLRAFLGARRSFPAREFSKGTLDALRKRFADSRRTESPSKLWKSAIARLVSDSWTAPLAGVRREASPTDSRQLVFEAEGLTIALNIQSPTSPTSKTPKQETSERRRVYGQVFSADEDSAEMKAMSVHLSTGDGDVFSSTIDEMGEFEFDVLAPKLYELVVTTPTAEVYVYDLNLID